MEFHSRWPSEPEFASGDRTHRIKNERWMVNASHRDARITTRASLRVKGTDLSHSRTRLGNRHRRTGRFQLSTDRLSCLPAAVGVQSAAANHPQATRRNVFEPATQEFLRRQLHAFLLAVAVIAVLEHHGRIRHQADSLVGDRAARHVACQIAGHRDSVRVAFLETHIPANSAHTVQQRMTFGRRH